MPLRPHTTARCVLAAVLAVTSARAQSATPAHGAEVSADAAARAKEHFQKGRQLYQAGAYREAIVELEAARALDPRSKELVFNLAIVHEKLGDVDQAIHLIQSYGEMDLDPQERGRSDAYLKRLEGAKKEIDARLAAAAAAQAAAAAAGGSASGGTGTPPPPSRGRVDAATLTAASFAAAGLAFGTVFGIKALADQPGSFVTGKDGSYSDYMDRQHTAHTEAVLADVGFGVGVAAAAIAAYLYFGRTKEAPQPAAVVSFGPILGGGRGGVVGIAGSF